MPLPKSVHGNYIDYKTDFDFQICLYNIIKFILKLIVDFIIIHNYLNSYKFFLIKIKTTFFYIKLNIQIFLFNYFSKLIGSFFLFFPKKVISFPILNNNISELFLFKVILLSSFSLYEIQ